MWIHEDNWDRRIIMIIYNTNDDYIYKRERGKRIVDHKQRKESTKEAIYPLLSIHAYIHTTSLPSSFPSFPPITHSSSSSSFSLTSSLLHYTIPSPSTLILSITALHPQIHSQIFVSKQQSKDSLSCWPLKEKRRKKGGKGKKTKKRKHDVIYM